MDAQIIRIAALSLAGASSLFAQGGPPDLPPVPEPAEYRITAARAVLGKMLFWEEQLSSHDTISCGSCHLPTAGGGDPVDALHPDLHGRATTEATAFRIGG